MSTMRSTRRDRPSRNRPNLRKNRRAAGFTPLMNLQIALHKDGASLPMHRHEDARMIVVLEGVVRETDISGAQIYKKGDILFRPAFCAHANAAGAAPAMFLRLPVSRKLWLAFAAKNGWRAASGRLQLEDRHQRALLRSKCGDPLFEFLCERDDAPAFGSTQIIPDEWRAKIIMGAPWSAVAEATGKKPYQLTRLFARRYGLTPTAFRREARLRRALRLLATTDEHLAQISAQCGYADQSHFSRDIKNATGRAPGALRAAMIA